MHFHVNCICAAIFCLKYDLKSFSSFLCSLLLKSCGCFSPYNIQSFIPFSCLIVAFPRSFVYKAVSLACWLNSQSRSSLFCCCLLSIIKCTLSSCTFHFFEPVFVISWSSSLTNKFHSFDLFYLPSLSSSRSKFSTFSSFSIRFCSCRFSLLLFFFSSAIRLVLIHSNTVKSCFQAYVFSSPKILYFFSKKKSCNNAVSGLISQSQR